MALLALAGSSGAMTSSSGADPWIASDQADYAPGSTVHLTGGNWQPGEEVRILTNDTLGNTWSQTDTVTADPSGAIADDVVLPSYFISDYTVTATAASGTATTTFTDAVNYQFLGKDGIAHTSAGGEEDLGSVTSGSTVSATCSTGLTTKATGLGGAQSTSYAISYVSGYGENASLSSPGSRTQINPASGTFVGNGSTCTSLTISTTGLAAGTYHGELQMRNTGGATATTDIYFFKFTVTQPQQATSISGVSGSGTYGGTATLTATLKAGTTPLGGKLISFTINGSAAGTATTDASGVATLSGASLAGINAGTGAVGASFAGDSGFLGSSGSGSLTVAKASSTTVVSCPASVTYDGSAKTPCSANATGAGGLNQALTVTYSDNTAAGTATASASYGGDGNHDGSSDSKTFTIAKAPSTTTVNCAATVTYDGSAKTPCSANATGIGGLDQPVAVDYSNNTGAGTATASATFSGDSNHDGSSGSATFNIEQAASTVSVSCPDSRTYTGGTLEPCSAKANGAGGLNEDLGVSYSDNVDAGTATASAAFAGDANHHGSNGSNTFTIDKAPSNVTVSCAAGPFTYDGSPQTPCSAKATGAGGLDVTLTVSYADNVNAGTATASATYGGDANHEGDNDSETFAIAKAPSTVAVSCSAGPFIYSGSPHTPCSGNVTGAGGLDQSVPVSYSDNVGAGTATASASYDGDANHLGDSASKTFTIDKAPSHVTVTCPDTRTYTGSAIEPCTAGATGAGGLDAAIAISYASNVDAGTATASATYSGDSNHLGDSGSSAFTIAKAPSTVTVSCAAGPFTFNGSPQTPCSGKATGAGGLDVSLSVSYSDNVNAGTATASASYDGDANHLGDSSSKTFTIGKATPTVSVNWTTWTFDGTAHPASGSVTGVGGAALGTPTFTYYSGTGTSGTPLAGAPSGVGTYTVLAGFAGTSNYTAASKTKTVGVLYRWDGFLQPINDTAHQGGFESFFKLGSTIPAKFQLKKADGTVVQAGALPTFSRSTTPVTCDTQIAPETLDTDTAFTGSTFRWDSSAQQYIYNWSTKGLKAGEYRIYAMLDDGSKQYVDICLQ